MEWGWTSTASAAAVCPTADFNDVTFAVEVLVDRVRIGDEVALVILEQSIDGATIVRARIAIKHVLFWGY